MLRDLASSYAAQYGVDPQLFQRLISQESAWNPNAVSPVGAEGLAQIMPETARDPGFGVAPVSDRRDPDESLRFGAEYLSKMLERYGGDTARALVAYNWGAGNADRWDGDLASLPAETRNYVLTITRRGSDLPSRVGGDDQDQPRNALASLPEQEPQNALATMSRQDVRPFLNALTAYDPTLKIEQFLV
ncbi:lytic transglycosylase domain-containing protein [Thalassobius sp. S69A]|uniref:lytic transglycosylase domain-containing protein n=1 Tax=unclassified Thalassovita TaxID=2619711 RepID=UPI003C7ABDEB